MKKDSLQTIRSSTKRSPCGKWKNESNNNAQKSLFQFGEQIRGFSVPVLNECELRASAGILFVLSFFPL